MVFLIIKGFWLLGVKNRFGFYLEGRWELWKGRVIVIFVFTKIFFKVVWRIYSRGKRCREGDCWDVISIFFV